MARSTGARWRWLSAGPALTALAMAAHAGSNGNDVAPAPPASVHAAKVRGAQAMQAERPAMPPAVVAPSAALLEYLGRYGDAADGVDPLGLADAAAAAAEPGGQQP